jgi:hypothetical protein
MKRQGRSIFFPVGKALVGATLAKRSWMPGCDAVSVDSTHLVKPGSFGINIREKLLSGNQGET